MSPEPTHEDSIDQSFDVVSSNVELNDFGESDSLSDDENIELVADGYLPLAQSSVDTNDDHDSDDNFDTADEDDREEDKWASNSDNQLNSSKISSQSSPQNSELINVWTSKCDRISIDLDTDKINQVKSMMAGFTLPTTAIPQWANILPEDVWKNRLINRIKEIQENQENNT